ncbi:uncharacterized protein PG986_009484 [Apiospora aurea]|uniref:Uncharacterized protein n=1 Tax=Apiospora aurea TaxID=335848 RepID=A0ABR1Q825_9PEZI
MSTYAPSYYLSPLQSPPQEPSLYQQQQQQSQYLHPYRQQQQEYQQNYQQPHQHHERPKPPPLLSVKVLFESSGNAGSGRRVSIGFRNTQQAEHYAQFVRSKTIHHTERLSCKVQGRYASVRLPTRVTEVVACLAGPGAGASRVGGFYFVFNDPILAQEWVDCLLLWRHVPGSKRKLYVERDVRDDVLYARLGMATSTGGPVALIGGGVGGGGGNDTEYQQYHANFTSPVSLLAPSKTTTEEVVTIYSAEGEEVVSPGLEQERSCGDNPYKISLFTLTEGEYDAE